MTRDAIGGRYGPLNLYHGNGEDFIDFAWIQ
jgi:hypothetical protein